MKKYEAPVVEVEIFAVGNVMNDYPGQPVEPELPTNETDIL